MQIKDFIKWVDFNVSYDALKLTAKLDIKSHTENSSTTRIIGLNFLLILHVRMVAILKF